MTTSPCEDLAASLVDYVDGSLPAAARASVAEHLAGCSDCAATHAALIDLPPRLRVGGAEPDDRMWAAQRQRIMQRIEEAETAAERAASGFDWRLVMPIAAALVIALAGYLSLRPPSTPGTVVLDALAPDDLAALIEVAGDLVPADDLLPDVQTDTTEVVEGAIEVEWIRADDLPGWGSLDDDDLDDLHDMLG